MTNNRHQPDGGGLRMLPCPFCDEAIKHIESWAKSFDPPRLYHEWQHPKNDKCYIYRMRTIVESATDDPQSQADAMTRWNTRKAAPPKPAPDAWHACSTCRSHTNCQKAGCCLYPQTTVLPAAPPRPAPDAVRLKLGDIVRANETFPHFNEWRNAEMKVVSLRVDPKGNEWVSVIEGSPRHRGNGVYDSETTDINADWLTPLSSAPSDGAVCLKTWIAREFMGHGVAVRRKVDDPIPGEPFISMAGAKELTRRAVSLNSDNSLSPAVARRWRHVNDPTNTWHYQEGPLDPHNEYIQAEPLYATPPATDRDTLYAILSKHIPQDMIDGIWQEIQEARRK